MNSKFVMLYGQKSELWLSSESRQWIDLVGIIKLDNL